MQSIHKQLHSSIICSRSIGHVSVLNLDFKQAIGICKNVLENTEIRVLEIQIEHLVTEFAYRPSQQLFGHVVNVQHELVQEKHLRSGQDRIW